MYCFVILHRMGCPGKQCSMSTCLYNAVLAGPEEAHDCRDSVLRAMPAAGRSSLGGHGRNVEQQLPQARHAAPPQAHVLAAQRFCQHA